MGVRLEHANLAVRDVDATIRFLQTAFPEFRVRREGKTSDRLRWVHVGTEETYIAINEASVEPAEAWVAYGGKPASICCAITAWAPSSRSSGRSRNRRRSTRAANKPAAATHANSHSGPPSPESRRSGALRGTGSASACTGREWQTHYGRARSRRQQATTTHGEAGRIETRLLWMRRPKTG